MWIHKMKYSLLAAYLRDLKQLSNVIFNNYSCCTKIKNNYSSNNFVLNTNFTTVYVPRFKFAKKNVPRFKFGSSSRLF
jgi:hypothetical protein